MLRLKPGDSVALVAPASGQKKGQEHRVAQAIAVLQDWGLRVVHPPLLEAQHYLAADDIRRADSLKRALTSPDIKAIFVTRGGYGCARLLPYLNGVNIPSPRYLVGFSDVTTLHLHFQSTPQLICVHASNLATELFLAATPAAAENQRALKAFLFQGERPPLNTTPLLGNPLSLTDKALTGGCLSLLVTSLGTPHEIQTADKVLMIEEVCESPYKIDRMLTHLKNAGKFERVKGIVIGELTGCDSPHIAALSVVKTVLADCHCPVLYSPTFGHGDLNLPWHYH